MGEYDYVFKIVVAGPKSCGKTSIVNRLIKDFYDSELSATEKIDLGTKIIQIRSDPTLAIRLQLWNIPAALNNSRVTAYHLQTALAVLLVYDVTNKNTFNEISNCLELIKKKSGKNLQIYLVGNKSDLEQQRQVSFKEGNDYAETMKLDGFFETSAEKNETTFVSKRTEIKEMFTKISIAIHSSSRLPSQDNFSPISDNLATSTNQQSAKQAGCWPRFKNFFCCCCVKSDEKQRLLVPLDAARNSDTILRARRD